MSDLKAPVTVLGGGSFGTTLANLMATNGVPARLWLRDEEQAEAMREKRENSRYLPGVQLDPRLIITSDAQAALADAELVFLAIPSGAFRSVLKQLAPALAGKGLISTTKGIEQPGFLMMSQIVEQEVAGARVAVLSGPNLAREIAAGDLTATVIASEDDQLNAQVQSVLGCPSLRVYASRDRYGVELGGALKNVYAIISGMAAAMGVGENTRAMLITRSLAEMTRFAVHLGANPMTFLGLAGVGDLIVTCTSPLSRNYQVGHALGQGLSLEDSVARLGQVAEGVNTLRVLHSKSEAEGVYMPLVAGLHAIIFEQQPLQDVIGRLMGAEQKHDVEFSAFMSCSVADKEPQ